MLDEGEREAAPQSAPNSARPVSLSIALGAGAALAGLVYDPNAGAADAKRAILLVAAILALAITLAKLRRGGALVRMEISAACALWIGFVAWSAFSLVWGSPPGVATLGTYVGATGLLAASMALPRSSAERAAGVAAALIGGGSSIAAIAQALAGARGLAIHGGQGNPNWLGLMLSIALPLSIDLAVDLRRSRVKLWGVVAALAILEVPALILSHSRVAWAATAASFLVWTASARWGRRGHFVAAAAIATAFIAKAAIAVAAVGTVAVDPGEPRLAAPAVDEMAPGSIDTPLPAAWEGRVWIWTASADAARRALPFGEGLGGFPAAYLEAQGARLQGLDPKAASRRFLNATTAHCDWIEAAVVGGIPGLALLIGAIGGGIAGLLRRRWSAGAAALAAFVITALGDSPIHQPAALILVVLALGAAPRRQRAPKRKVVLAVLGATLAGAALLLATSTGAWLCVRRLTSAKDALPEQRIAMLASASRLDPRSGEAALSLGLARFELGDTHAALRDLSRSRALLPNIGTYVAIGNAHVVEGDYERAVNAYTEALALHPGYFRAHANLAEALLSMGRLDEAASHLATAQALWPGHPKLAEIAERLRRARIESDTAPPPDR